MLKMTYSETRLVKRSRGTMPVILTAPHGGSEQPPGVNERTEGATPADCAFNKSRDNETLEIAEAVAQKILTLTGLYPYAVFARFHRKFIDANREARCAYTDSSARPFYDEYHDRIDGYVDQILAQNGGRGFLFDIHGTGIIRSDPADVYLGTANGATLRPDFPRANLFLRHGLNTLLERARHETFGGGVSQFTISPADAGATETAEVNGGFTVRRYGRKICSVQVEIAASIRNDGGKREFFVEDLAYAIINSVRRYAPF
ncbi:MAG: N-formylglutamate amidohydrolase [Methylocystis sp.]|nr:N-formylglutamate amidohydrolase [Methylocystis sp.]